MSTLSPPGPIGDDAVDAVDAAHAPDPSTDTDRGRRSSGLFRAFWRWHFYASVLVIPIMLALAVTGLIYLFRWQIDPAMHPGVLTVTPPATGTYKPYAEQEAAALAAVPGGSVTGLQEGAQDRATIFTVASGEDTRNVYVDPYTAKVQGVLQPRDLLSNVAVEIHGTLMTGELIDHELFTDPVTGSPFTWGSIGDRIIELAACWAIVMTATGYYLFFRGRTARLRRVSRGVKAAALRHRHGLVGALLGGGLLLLVVSGLPWTGLWGDKVQQLASGQGLSLWGEDPGAESTLAAKLDAAGTTSAPAPWAEGQATVPTSGPHAGHDMTGMVTTPDGTMRIGIERALSAARADGLAGPVYVAYPQDEKGVFSVLSDQWHDVSNPAFTDVSQERTVHIDQYSGEVVGRYGYADYTAVAKVVSQGIALHEGRRFGSFNLVATTAFCLGVIFLCVTGPLMWWKRRPRGAGLAAPRGRMPLRAMPGLAVLIVLLGVFLPLFGLSLLVVLVIDRLLNRRSANLSRRLGTV